MKITNINSKDPKEIVSFIGQLFDSSLDEKSLDKLLESIEIANNIDLSRFDNHSLAVLNYFLGNAWSYVFKLKNPIPNFDFEVVELEREIIYYRKALDLIKDCDDKFVMCQILTNLGNLFSHIGRVVEAQEYFNLCLELNRKFGMAIGNMGFGLYYYARVVFEPDHQFIFLKYARKFLSESLTCSDVYLDAKRDFYRMVKHIESVFDLKDLNTYNESRNYYKTQQQDEIHYRNWCAGNRLFINSLNDIFTSSIAASDFLFTPSMVLHSEEKPIYQTIYNQLKQEYVSARFLFYESLFFDSNHFSDKDVTLMDTLDRSVYSLKIEKMKIAFRMCYSLFDKISYFLNLYFKLGNKPDKVTFRNIWYKDLKKNSGLNEVISKSENWALRGLYWLSKDLYEKEFDITIEPQAREIAKIRNYIEHKSFKVVEARDLNYIDETATYEISRALFTEKTLKVIKLSRSALMYLSYLIYDEESQRTKNREQRVQRIESM